MYECFNYKNLQPLWRKDNIKKSNKIFLDNNPKGDDLSLHNLIHRKP